MKKVIGIDLGGTKINGAVVDSLGNILKQESLYTDRSGNPGDVIRSIEFLVSILMKGEKIEAIGIGSPGFIDSDKGEVLSVGGNIRGWAGTNIRKPLVDRFKIPVQVENDANVAGLCEAWIGAGKDKESFVMLTVGTGLGGAIYTRSKGLWRGNHFQAAEVGHSILYPGGSSCSCGQKGCVEKYVSGSAIEDHYERLTGFRKTGEEIFHIMDRDRQARYVIEKFTWDFANYLVSIKNIFDPQAIIIGGGVILSREYWWDRLMDDFRKEVNTDPGIEILPSMFLNDSGTIGAAKAAMDILGLDSGSHLSW